MFTRSMFKREDIIDQSKILNNIAKLLDIGKIQTTLSLNLGEISIESIKKAHNILENHRNIGKIILVVSD
jgi:NADPH2:quinone reductase